MGGRSWTEDELIYLEYLLYSGDEASYKEAAVFLNRTVSAITKKMWRMRKDDENFELMRRNYTAAEEKYIKNAYMNTPLKIMAEHLGRSPASLCRKMKEMDLRINARLKDFDEEIRKLAEDGYYQSEIARKLGLNKKSVHSYTKKHGIKCEPAPKEIMLKYFKDLETIRFAEMKYRRQQNGRYRPNK